MQIAFEPVTSSEYDIAFQEYTTGLGFLNGNGRYDHLRKAHLTLCVSMLRDLYKQGEVESIASLPLPHEICWFDEKDLKGLAKKLGQLYFPNRNH
jgi:hypothetical protein